jgi:hypothetical protein
VTDAKSDHESTLVERWLQEQQEWQRTLLSYVDSMVKSDEFLVNLGNAMRGSLLAGKPYPAAGATAPAPGDTPSQADERLDRILFALNTLQGQLQDLFMSIEEIRRAVGAKPVAPPKAPAKRRTKNARSAARPRKARA